MRFINVRGIINQNKLSASVILQISTNAQRTYMTVTKASGPHALTPSVHTCVNAIVHRTPETDICVKVSICPL